MQFSLPHTLTCPAAGLDVISGERQRRLDSRARDGEEALAELEAALIPWDGTPLRPRVLEAYQFALGLNYQHPGLSSAAYLAHPVRVAVLALRLRGGEYPAAAVLALLHNAYEVSTVGQGEVQASFGESIATAIETLTVDRTAKSREYTVSYYTALQRAPAWVRIVKVLDKLDNLFVLDLNPDARRRDEYLREFHEFVLPMAQCELPETVDYLKALAQPDGALNTDAGGR